MNRAERNPSIDSREPRRTRPATRHTARRAGFALIVTISLLVLLGVVVTGLLSLSVVQLRSSRQGEAQAAAMANARLAMLLAIGELQKTMGNDQTISAPAGILDASPESPTIDGLAHPYLTGTWEARSDTLEATPDYDREKPFKGWLVSNARQDQTKQLSFATDGSLDEAVLLAQTPAADETDPSSGEIRAGRVRTERGAMAWWVGDENCKARVNPSNQFEREDSAEIAELLAGFATPGPSGVQALAGFDQFPSNTAESDKLITRDLLELLPGTGTNPKDHFHNLTPYSESILTNVTDGSLRKDLNLYLERTDLNWLEKWARADGVSGFPRGPLGPNGKIALSDPREYDTLCWKYLHHWYNMHRQQIQGTRDPQLTAMDNSTPGIDQISNPGWNTGVTLVTPVMVRMQMLMSYGVTRLGSSGTRGKDRFKIWMYSYPAVTLWNPYNVKMLVPQWSVFLHTMPLEHTIFINGQKHMLSGQGTRNGNYNWGWPHGNMVMRFGASTPRITLRPGEAKVLTYSKSERGGFHAHDMVTRMRPWLPPHHVGHPRDLGEYIGTASDRITIKTKAAEWDTSSTSYGGQNFQTTFGFRCEPKAVHRGHPDRFRKQMFCGQVCWRREPGNPSANTISETNFPSKQLAELIDAPTPFVHLDVRLKTLDEPDLPNKTWLHNIPSHPFAAATSTKMHGRRGFGRSTTFFAHPYTVSFEQKTNLEGVFQNRAFFGPSNSPEGGLGAIAAREVPLAPLTSLAQLQNLPQVPIEGLNWNGYYFQNHAIGNSFASPGLAPDDIKERSFPFYLGEYFAWQAGDITGTTYGDNTAFTNDDYMIRSAPSSVVDRSYVANHLLFDDYFFSSMAAHSGTFFRSYGKERNLRQVVRDFYDGTKALPNEAYRPYLPAGRTTDDLVDSLVSSRGTPAADAYLKAAAHLMATGGFNVNSTSVEAWTVMLAAAHMKRPVTNASGRPQAEDRARFVVSRFSMPIGPAADGSSGPDADESRWLGYRELTPDELRQLAAAIVEQVKTRGPFRSLGEFVNRRRTSSPDDTELARYGALQAALEDPDVEINSNYNSDVITEADIAGANYKFKEAALGSRFHGTPACISQADLLMPLAPIINARSDTFLIRAYGEARSPDGTKITARAWCEAVVQRFPDYLDTADPAETASADLGSKANQLFGRRFRLKTFRWLSAEEMKSLQSQA